MAGFGGQARAIGDLRSIFITVADAARDMFDIFAGKAAGIGGNAVKKIDRLVDTISSISDAVGDMVKMIEVLKNAQKTLNLAGLLNDSAGQSQIVTWVNSLTAMGRRMVEAAKQASLSLSQSTVDEFKRLADAINSVTSIATGTVALVQAMLGALKFDWAGFDTATAAAGLGKIAGIASELVKAAAGAAVAIKNVDTSGLAPLKEAADNTLGVVTSTLALVQALGDALKVDWGAIDFAEAGRMMHDLAGMVVYFAGKAQEASLAIAKIDTTGLGPLKTAADALIGIADDARSLVEKLVDALTVKWGDIDWPAAGRMMHDLAQMAVYFVGKAAEAAAGLKDIDASGLAPLASLAQNLLTIVDQTTQIVKASVDALTNDWPALDSNQIVAFVGSLVALAVRLANAAGAAVGSWTTTAIPALSALGTVLQDALSTIDSVFKIAEQVALGNMASVTGSEFVTWAPARASSLENTNLFFLDQTLTGQFSNPDCAGVYFLI
jgi:hypothetical protein